MRSSLRIPVVLLSLTLFSSNVSVSYAQSSAQSKVAAEALFDQGRKLMKDKKFKEACTKFEESNRLDPGVGILLYLADCYEQDGRLASAWGIFREAAGKAQNAGQTGRYKTATERADKLKPRLSSLTIHIAEGNPVDAMSITLSGKPVVKFLWNTPMPVDPGEHQIVAKAEGYKEWQGTIKLGNNADKKEIEVPVLEKDPNADVTKVPTPPPTNTANSPEPSTPPPPPPPPPEDTGSTQRTIGLIVGGVGIVGLGVGSFFGFQAMSKNKDAKDLCPRGNNLCDSANAETLTSDARSAATISTITFGVGAAALVGGLVLFFTAPSAGGKEAPSASGKLRLSPLVGPTLGGVQLGGSF
jgi:hypothetical protein